MKINKIMQHIFAFLFKKNRTDSQKQNLLAIFLILVLLILSLGIIQGSFGKLSRSFMLSDSAIVAEFDVIITAPKNFGLEQGESIMEYHFLSNTDVQGFIFQIANNGELDILCRPYFNANIAYRIYVDGEELAEFVVAAKESENIWLIIAPIGLDTKIKVVKLYIDIQQLEGR